MPIYSVSSSYECMQISFLIFSFYTILCIVIIFLSIFRDLACSICIFSGLLQFFPFLTFYRHTTVIFLLLHMFVSTEDICDESQKSSRML